MVPLVIAFVLTGTGTGLAYWAASGTGEGAAVAGTARPLTAVGTTSPGAGQLYPGGSSGFSLQVSNPNPYPVTITGVTANGPVTATGGIGSCTTTGVSLAAPTGGLPFTVGPEASLTVTLAGAATMSNASDNGCQGATFTIPVALVGSSG